MYITIDSEKGIIGSENLNFMDALRLIGSATLQIMNDVDATIKENAKDSGEYEQAHGKIYDMYNFMAGNILDQFDGTRSPATDLTAEAILRAENEILDEKVPTIEPEEVEEIEPIPTEVAESTEEETNSPA